MSSHRMIVILLAAVPCFVGLASASPIVYDVVVNTSLIAGTAGSLDFNFNPGPLVSQSASLQILNFTSSGSLDGACPCGIGDVSGQLPSTLTFDNGSSFNDYFDSFTFASALSFQVSLYGAALSAPDASSTSGSAFAFSMFSNTAGTIPTLTSDSTNGFAFTLNVNLDGTTSLVNSSAATSVFPETSTVPEPDSMALAAIGAAIILMAGLFRPRCETER